MDAAIIRTAVRHLRKSDVVMTKIISQSSPLVFNKSSLPHYHSLVRAIINQQLSVKASHTIEKRLQQTQGGRFFRAEEILKLKATALRSCGLSNNKVRYIRTLAQAIVDGELNFRSLVRCDDDGVREQLVKFPGIGQWSADMFLISALRRPDVFPVGDLVLRKSIQHHYKLPVTTVHEDLIAIAELWRPFRSIATFYLWHAS